jgi:hypothetical protein
MVQVKALREPLNERAEPKQREHDDCRKSVDRMTYEWHDNGVKHVPTWSKAVRDAMLKGGAEFERQKALNRAAGNWSKVFLRTTDTEIGTRPKTGKPQQPQHELPNFHSGSS